jgi:hypothetical protein
MPFRRITPFAPDGTLAPFVLRLRNEERVELIMSFYRALKEFRDLAARSISGQGPIRFEDINRLIEAHMRPVKDSCHQLFRDSSGREHDGVLQAIFDMAFGILFHLLLKAKENLRLRENYNIDRLEELVIGIGRTKEPVDVPPGLTSMFDRLAEEIDRDSAELEAELDRAYALFNDLEALFNRIIQVYHSNTTIIRSLYSHRDFFGQLFPGEGIERLFARIYPKTGAVEAYLQLGFDFLRSGHESEAEAAFALAFEKVRRHRLPLFQLRELFGRYRDQSLSRFRGQADLARLFETRLREMVQRAPLQDLVAAIEGEVGGARSIAAPEEVRPVAL